MDSVVSRRSLLRSLGLATAVAPFLPVADALAQGRCMTTFGAPECNTAAIPPVFAPTGWKTTAFDHVTFQVADYKKEAAFYASLMGFTLRSDDGTQAVMDVGQWGTVIFKQDPAAKTAVIDSFGFVIDKWDAKSVEAELTKRGLMPVADHDGKGFESFRVKDPDGFDLQIANGNGLPTG